MEHELVVVHRTLVLSLYYAMEAESAEAADIPIHVLGRYECADGGVINPVGVLDSSLDAEVLEGHDVTGESLGQEAVDDTDDAVARNDSNLPQSLSPSALNSTTDGYMQPPFSCMSCCTTFLRHLRGQTLQFCCIYI